MTIEEALQIIEDHKDDKWDDSVNRVIAGFRLLEKHGITKFDIAAERNHIYGGAIEKTVATMSEEEVIQMVRWGWCEEEKVWCIFT